MAQDFWSTNYYGTEYWSDNYWPTEAVAGSGSYWSSNYWSTDYYATNYWAVNAPTGEPIGPLATVLADATANIDGTFVAVQTFTGTIPASTEDHIAALVGEVAAVINFDVSVNIGVPWTMTAFELYTGPLADTLEDASSSFTGSFIQASGFTGSIATTLGDGSADFDGTHVAPASVSGSISVTLDNNPANLDGTFVDPSVFLGSISTSTEDVTGEVTGTYDAGTFTGSIGVTLEDFTPNITAVYAEAGAGVGPFVTTLDDMTVSMVGTVVGDYIYESERRAGRKSKNPQVVGSRRSRKTAGSRRGRAKIR